MGKSRPNDSELGEGVYERLITEELLGSLAKVPQERVVSAFLDQAGSLLVHAQRESVHSKSPLLRTVNGLGLTPGAIHLNAQYTQNQIGGNLDRVFV